MSYCGGCGHPVISSEIKFCPECGVSVARADSAVPSGEMPPLGNAQMSDPTVVGALPTAERENATPSHGHAHGDSSRKKHPRWVGPAVIAVVGLTALALAAVVSLAAFNWLTGDGESGQPGWLYREGTPEDPAYGLAVTTDEGFGRGPRLTDGWLQTWNLVGEKGTVMLPKFGAGYAAMISQTDSDTSRTTSILEVADSETVSDLDVQSGSVDTQLLYADRRKGALYYSVSGEDMQSCRVIFAKDSKPFEVATGRSCRWAPDGRAVATDWSATSASFRVFDVKGRQLAAGEFPKGNYEDSGEPRWQPAGGWIWAVGTDEPAESEGQDGSYKYYAQSLRALDLNTGQLVASIDALDISVMAAAEQGRGLVAALDNHKETLDAVYLGPDGKEAARINAVASAQAVISPDGTQAWLATDNGRSVKVNYLAPGAQPREVLKPAPKAVTLLRAREGQLLLAAQGDTPDAYRVFGISPTGGARIILEGKASGMEDRSSELRIGAESEVRLASVGDVDLISAPAAEGSWSTIWQVMPDKATVLIPVVDYGEGDSAQARVVSGSDNETVVLYSRGGQEKLVALRQGKAIPLGESPFLDDLGFADGKFWFNSKRSESDRWQTKSVDLDGKDAPEEANLTLASVAGTSQSSHFSYDGYVTTAWADPLRAECLSTGYPDITKSGGYYSTNSYYAVCADLKKGQRVNVTVSDEAASATMSIVATDKDDIYIDGKNWVAPDDGFYRIVVAVRCGYYCATYNSRINIADEES